MQIVSGSIGKEKVHYVAPPRESLEKEMQGFFKWLNNDKDLSIIKAGIAHLWFVIIHPLKW
jgi:Fic family protein